MPLGHGDLEATGWLLRVAERPTRADICLQSGSPWPQAPGQGPTGGQTGRTDLQERVMAPGTGGWLLAEWGPLLTL